MAHLDLINPYDTILEAAQSILLKTLAKSIN